MPLGPGDLIDPVEAETDDAAGGLLESVKVIEPGDSQDARRWETGFSYRPAGTCGPGQVWAPCAGATRVVDVNTTPVKYVPFSVVTAFKCGSRGLTEAERVAAAETAMDWYQGENIELEFWTGDLAIAMYADEIGGGTPAASATLNPFLANAATLSNLSGGLDSPLMYALASLQQALRECLGSKRRGVIHATTKLVSLWYKEGGLVTEPSGAIRDPFDNLVVCGGGYDGSSPVTVDATGAVTAGGTLDPSGRTEWAYATGPVNVRLGPVTVNPDSMAEALDKTVNDVTFDASRTAAAYFDPCCHLGILVNLCDTACSATGS